MATQAEIEILLKQLKKAPPSALFQNIDKSTVGIRAVLQYLYETDEVVTAGKLSEKMGVSTARVAVLLKKMAAKGLVEKEADPTDGRVVVVRLSEYGKETALKIREDIYARINTMIDKVGMERMLEFAEISNEIHSVMEKPEFDI